MSFSILATVPLSAQWQTLDPFLFCVHHNDHYPAGNGAMGIDQTALGGRNIGMDFSGRDGWSMYHGQSVPGFPQHPHRGFETVTLARRGYIDHSDSLGAAARFGEGDVQWMTAGRGIVHSEMFPLLDNDNSNPAELFQIWLNLPARNKFAEPHFSMFWADDIPNVRPEQSDGVNVVVVAGTIGERAPPTPPPDSWASVAGSDVAIWTIEMAADAQWVLPAAVPGLNRVLYLFDGQTFTIDDQLIPTNTANQVRSEASLTLKSGEQPAQLLMLQGRPIGEPVAQHGPFVMNSSDEIRQAMTDYQRTRFGGWPWTGDDPVHERGDGRFARHPDGVMERPT
jgi:quercetin 2,3-dioxygenase